MYTYLCQLNLLKYNMINDSKLKCYRLNKFDKTDKMLTDN